MTLTLLLDLDDTLLESNIEKFIPAYMQSLSTALGNYVAPEIMIEALMGGTRRMMGKVSPIGTLKSVFDEYFYQKIGVDQKELEQVLDNFYDNEFPKLFYLTNMKPDAIKFVNWAVAQNYRIVIATNPLFPVKAIHHRLKWAGLDPETYNFHLVTSYENSHFTKENISYFPEILGRLGWLDDAVLMVGNDLNMDIYPAKAAGLPVFWVTKNLLVDDDECKNLPHGKIGTIPYWIESVPGYFLQYSNKEKSSLMAELNSTPAIFDDFYCDFQNKECNTVNRSFVSSTLNHLISTELEIIHPFLRQCQETGCTTKSLSLPDDITEDSCNKDFGPENNLQVFMKARIETINMIRGEKINWKNLNPESSISSGDFFNSIQFISQHDKKHIRKITSSLATH